MFDGQFFEWVSDEMLNPFIHLIFVKASLIVLPISTPNFSIDRERGVVPV